MKKGLLGLVVAALTVVGCQNYDDQFDDLNKKIAALSTEVTSLSSVQTAVTALGTKLDNLAGSALTDSDLAGILDEVAAVKAAVDAIDNSAVEAEVADLNAEVDEILEKLGELLSANAVIPGDLVIANLGDLAAAQELIGTEADDPLVTIQGNVHIDISATNGLKDSIAAVNAIANKLKIVQQTVTVTTVDAVTLNELMYVNGNFSVSKAGSVAAPKLRTVNGDVTLATSGALSYPLLSSATKVTLSETAGTTTITSVDLSGLASGAITTAANELTLPNATSVKVGGVLPASVTLTKAVEFVSSYSGAAQTATHISVGGAAATFSLGATKFTDQVTITTTGAINLSGVTEAKALNVVATDINLSGMTKFTGATTLSATTINIGAMVSNSAAVTLVGPTTALSLPALTTLGADLTATTVPSFSAPKLATSTGTINIKDNGTVELLSLTAATDLADRTTLTGLTLGGQKVDVDLTSFAKMATLNYTGAHPSSITPGSHEASNNLNITSTMASLTTLVIGDGGIGTLTVSATNLESLATNGHIINTKVYNNTKLETFDFGHRHADGDNATTIDITGNTDKALTSIDLSSLSKVKHVNITGNTSLTTIVAPSIDPLAEPLATVTVTISGNDTSGTYTAAVSATETTPYQPASATAAVVTAFKPFIEAYLAQTRTATVVWSIDVDNVDLTSTAAVETAALSTIVDSAAQNGPDGTNGNADDQSDGGAVTTKAELSLF